MTLASRKRSLRSFIPDASDLARGVEIRGSLTDPLGVNPLQVDEGQGSGRCRNGSRFDHGPSIEGDNHGLAFQRTVDQSRKLALRLGMLWVLMADYHSDEGRESRQFASGGVTDQPSRRFQLPRSARANPRGRGSGTR
jgi:hypothetical protein